MSAEAKLDDAGALVIDNATARLADEGTQGAKKKATLRGKRGRRAPSRRATPSKGDGAAAVASGGEDDGDEWDNDDNNVVTAGASSSPARVAGGGFPPAPSADVFGATPVSAVPDVFGGDDIFAGSPAKSSSLAFGALDDGPSIF